MSDKPSKVAAHEYSSADETLHAPPDANPDDDDLEWDDTPTSLQLRALFALLAGGFLLWSQARAPLLSQGLSGKIRTQDDWNRFVWLAVVANVLLPLGIVTLFFAQDIRRVPWLKNQALNAWSYGCDWSNWKSHLKWSLALFVLAAPLVWLASREPALRSSLDAHLPLLPQGRDMSTHARLFFSFLVLALCREWFFRGFLLFGFAQAVGPIVAVGSQAVVFALVCGAQWSLPVALVFAVGLVFGTVAWRCKSFAPCFIAHGLLLVLWLFLMR